MECKWKLHCTRLQRWLHIGYRGGINLGGGGSAKSSQWRSITSNLELWLDNEEESSGLCDFGKAELVTSWAGGVSDAFPGVIPGGLPRAYLSRHSNDLESSRN